MNNQLRVKILSVIIFLLTVIVGLTLDSLIFNSIVFSHYGGLTTVLSPYILSLAVSLAVGIILFAPSLLLLVDAKRYTLKLLLIILIGFLSCSLFIGIAQVLQVGIYGYHISEAFDQNILYIFTIAFVFQLGFLGKTLKLNHLKRSKKRSVLGVVLFLITTNTLAAALNIRGICEAHETRENQANFTKGNPKVYRIVLGEECGISPNEESGKKIIQFPESGLIILKTDENEFVPIDCKFYYTDDRNQQQELHIFDFWEDASFADEYERKNNVKGMTCSRTRYIPTSETDETYSGTASGAITHLDFQVYFKNSPYNKERFQQMDILTKELVRSCREKN